RPDVVLGLRVVCEVEQPGVLEESADHAHHANVVAGARDAGSQTADSPNYEIDLDAGTRRIVQRLDDLLVDDGVHLRNYTTRFPGACERGLASDHLHQPVA